MFLVFIYWDIKKYRVIKWEKVPRNNQKYIKKREKKINFLKNKVFEIKDKIFFYLCKNILTFFLHSSIFSIGLTINHFFSEHCLTIN